jgi:hypothetical protein
MRDLSRMREILFVLGIVHVCRLCYDTFER